MRLGAAYNSVAIHHQTVFIVFHQSVLNIKRAPIYIERRPAHHIHLVVLHNGVLDFKDTLCGGVVAANDASASFCNIVLHLTEGQRHVGFPCHVHNGAPGFGLIGLKHRLRNGGRR
jgi:hypothetical protein